jgi:hypothetical protein
MRHIFPILFLCQCALALQAPVITSIIALSDTSVRITWRDSDPGVLGYYVKRADPWMSVFMTIDTVPGTDTSYTDPHLLPCAYYGYEVVAFSASEVSPPSSYATVTTTGIRRVFTTPIVAATWDTAGKKVVLTIKDLSTIEKGYAVARSVNFGKFSQIMSWQSSAPQDTGDTVVEDHASAGELGCWLLYRVSVFNDSAQDTAKEELVFTYQNKQPPAAKILTLGQKLFDFKLHTVLWAVKEADTIVLNGPEEDTNVTLTRLVLVPDPPFVIAGTITARPLLLNKLFYSYYSFGNNVFSLKDDLARYFKYTNGSMRMIGGEYGLGLGTQCRAGGPVAGTRPVGIVNGNVLVSRLPMDKAVCYSLSYFDADTFAPIGSYSQPTDFCMGYSPVSFLNGKAYEKWRTFGQPGGICDTLDVGQEICFTFDFSRDPRSPAIAPAASPADTALREYDGYVSADPVLKAARAVFVDSVKSRVYLLSDSLLAAYSFTAATTSAGRPVLSQRDRNNPDITFHAASNRLLITGLLSRPGDKARVSLFSLNGKLLYAAQAGQENSIQVPRRMTGVVLARVEGQGYRVEKRVFIVR